MFFQLVCTTKGNKFVLLGTRDQTAALSTIKCPYCSKNITLVNGNPVTFQGNAQQHNLVAILDVAQLLNTTTQKEVKYCFFQNGILRGYDSANKTWTPDSDPLDLYRVLVQPPAGSPFTADQFSGLIWALMKISRSAWDEYAGSHTVACIQAFDRGSNAQTVLNQLVSRYQHIQLFRRLRELLRVAGPADFGLPTDQRGTILRPDHVQMQRLSTSLHASSGAGGTATALEFGGMEVGATESQLMATWRIMVCTGNGGTYAEIVDKLNAHLGDCGLNLDQMADIITCRSAQRATDRLIALLTPMLNGADLSQVKKLQQIGELLLTVSLLVGVLEPARRLSTNAFYAIVFHFWRLHANGVTATSILRIEGAYSIMSGIGTAMKQDEVKHVKGKISRRQKVANIVELLLRETNDGRQSVLLGTYDLKDLAVALITWQQAVHAGLPNISSPGLNPSAADRNTLAQIMALPASIALKAEFGKFFLADLQDS